MNKETFYSRLINFLKILSLTSVLAGFSEVLWINLYAAFKGISLKEVAWQILATIHPAIPFTNSSVVWGTSIHFFLSVIFCTAFILLIWPRLKKYAQPLPVIATTLVALNCVWALNFLVFIPHLNPKFLTLIPLWVAYISKTFFAIALGCALLYTNPQSNKIRQSEV